MHCLAICVYREPKLVAVKSILDLLSSGMPWRVIFETGDALISRARSTVASQWLLTSDDDVLVMTDDDFSFTPADVVALAALASDKRSIAAGVTPLRSGEYTAIVPLEPSDAEPWRDPTCPPLPIKWAGGLIAYHRSVFETLAQTLPLLHRRDRIPAFWPFFAPAMKEVEGQMVYLSEDYACHERARQAGFTVWVQPACQVGHLSEVVATSANLEQVRALFHSGQPVTT